MTYLEIVKVIKQTFEDNPLVTTVINDSLQKIDEAKKPSFPLVIFSLDTVPLNNPTNQFNFSFLIADILDVNNDSSEDNKDFIWNQSLAVSNNFVQRLKRGDLFSEEVQINTDAVIVTPFTDNYNYNLAGVAFDLSIVVRNNMTIC